MKAEKVLKKLKELLNNELSVCERIIDNFKKDRIDKAYGSIGVELFVEHYYYKGFADFILNKIEELEDDRG
jgi:hypothetical protein